MAARLSLVAAAACLCVAATASAAVAAPRPDRVRVVRVAAVTPTATAASGLSATEAPVGDCTIDSGSPTDASHCGEPAADIVGDDGSGSISRTMIAFPAGLGLPAGATILSSTLTINVQGAFGSTVAWIFQLDRPFSHGAASWNSYDGTHAWSAAGGDFDNALQAAQTVSAAGTASFSITPMTQAWADGTRIPELMMLPFSKAGNAFSFASVASGNGPSLTIAYQPPPPPAVASTPVPTPIPSPAVPRALHTKLVLAWTWSHAIVWLRHASIGRYPGNATLTVSCRKRGCPRPLRRTATGHAGVRRLLTRSIERRYRAGDVLTITLAAPGYRPKSARVRLRNGKVPLVSLLTR